MGEEEEKYMSEEKEKYKNNIVNNDQNLN